MNMKKILYVFLLLTAFSFIQPTNVMAATDNDQPGSTLPVQEECSKKDYYGCEDAPGCYWVVVSETPYYAYCEICPANHYCKADSVTPIKCKAPKSSAPAGSVREEDCTYYCSTLSRWLCQSTDGCYLDSDSNTCKICPENNYCEPYTQPVPCPDGTAPAGSNSPDDCKKDCSVATNKTICRNDYPGCYWDETSSNGKCTLCPSGYYCDSTSPYKHGCPDGYTSESGANAENDCKIICERYANNSDWCKTAAGCYYDDVEGCKTCTGSHYCVSGENSRRDCPNGAWSDEGAKSITDCYFPKIIIKETNSITNTSKEIEVAGKLHFFVPGNNYQIVQQPFESLDFCLPDFACD